MWSGLVVLLLLLTAHSRLCAPATQVTAAVESSRPLLSAANSAGEGRCTAASFCFNAAYVPGSQPGIIVRLRNHTGGENVGPSKLGFAALRNYSETGNLRCDDLTPDGIVFAPEVPVERNGTEDPRVAFDPRSKLYHLTYTAFDGHDGAQQRSEAKRKSPPYVALHQATTRTPSVAGSWHRTGPAFAWLDGHIQSNHTKSGAMLISPDGPPHYMIYLHTVPSSAFVATSADLTHWRPLGTDPILAPRVGHFDSHLTEPGPPPLPLSDGSWIFFYNGSAENDDYPLMYPGCVKVSAAPSLVHNCTHSAVCAS